MLVAFFVAFYIIALIAESKSLDTKIKILAFACTVLAFMAGFRDIGSWNDTGVYTWCFDAYTPSLLQWSPSMDPYGYEEKGFFLIGVLVKTFTDSTRAYLLVVSAITMWILYKVFREYAPYPLLGLAAYIARFFLGRNFMQIRAAIAYGIVLYGIKYITSRDWKRYFLVVFIGYLFHKSALIAVPLYFICLLPLKKWHVVAIIGVAFIIGGFFQGPLQSFVTDNADDLEVTKYTQGVEVEQAKGLSNPLIYFQCLFLFIYTFGEKKLRSMTADYETIRNGYMYSTFILISFCMFLGLSGRTSTCFATLEFIIIPSIANIFNRSYRPIVYVGIGILLTLIFSMNATGH